jgi:hypothetical protein
MTTHISTLPGNEQEYGGLSPMRENDDEGDPSSDDEMRTERKKNLDKKRPFATKHIKKKRGK